LRRSVLLIARLSPVGIYGFTTEHSISAVS
jgi:hypothetical protein